MPSYDYHCEKCGHDFTVMMTIAKHVKGKTKCPKCKSKKVKHKIEAFYAKTSRKS